MRIYTENGGVLLGIEGKSRFKRGILPFALSYLGIFTNAPSLFSSCLFRLYSLGFIWNNFSFNVQIQKYAKMLSLNDITKKTDKKLRDIESYFIKQMFIN